jgi:hypothetical protein
MPDVLLRRSGLILRPADGLAEQDMERFPLGRDLLCTLKAPRSNVHNRLYFACLSRVAENLDQAITKDALHEWLKLRLGYATPILLRSGKVEWVPESTRFNRMDQSEFNTYSKLAFEMIYAGFGIHPDDVKREGAELLGTDSSPAGPGSEKARETEDEAQGSGASVSRKSSERGWPERT